jgi:hypothetical protein
VSKLHNPERDLISKITGEVGFQDRLVGYRNGERFGSMRTSLYSFREVVDFLGDRFPQLPLEELEAWVRCTMGDEELAERISDAVREEPTDYARTCRIRDLMRERLSQCEESRPAE